MEQEQKDSALRKWFGERKPVRLMLLPDCCHGYSRDALPDYIAIQQETLDWLSRYGKDGEQ